MGIHGLTKLIGDYAPSAMKDGDIKTYFGNLVTLKKKEGLHLPFIPIAGRKVAVDASMSLYQFLIAVRTDGSQLTGSDGDTTRSVCVCVCGFQTVERWGALFILKGWFVCITLSQISHSFYSHLIGFFYRTIRMLENGIKPV